MGSYEERRMAEKRDELLRREIGKRWMAKKRDGEVKLVTKESYMAMK
jgi:hypothetical protein